MLSSAMLRRLFLAVTALSMIAFLAAEMSAPAVAAVFPSFTEGD